MFKSIYLNINEQSSIFTKSHELGWFINRSGNDLDDDFDWNVVIKKSWMAAH